MKIKIAVRLFGEGKRLPVIDSSVAQILTALGGLVAAGMVRRDAAPQPEAGAPLAARP